MIELQKVSVIDYDKKDCDLIACPQCGQTQSFSVFIMTQKKDHRQHLHVRCLLCESTYCTKVKELESAGCANKHDDDQILNARRTADFMDKQRSEHD